MKLATTIIGCLCLAGGARGKRGGEFNVQYLSLAEDGSVGQVACENTGEVICSTAILAGDFEGTAKVRFTQFDLNPFTGLGAYSGEIDLCVDGVLNGGKQNLLRKAGCTTGTLSNGSLAFAGLTSDGQPVFAVRSEVSTSGGDGYFKKLECDIVNTGSIDPSRAPYGEVLDMAITCTFNPKI
uniref:Uncharacterized protein n=1 Tax=Amphora coffeiformis TaxID=265554 RepID=A0A7S3PDV6_9STRA|mmetsp:Transcript_17394/g.33010  ORF Transcript_17394/g.33010 Transcript_17394/m.33010 type:complete len:182 (+) Transcript_17394:174-719(+)